MNYPKVKKHNSVRIIKPRTRSNSFVLKDETGVAKCMPPAVKELWILWIKFSETSISEKFDLINKREKCRKHKKHWSRNSSNSLSSGSRTPLNVVPETPFSGNTCQKGRAKIAAPRIPTVQ